MRRGRHAGDSKKTPFPCLARRSDDGVGLAAPQVGVNVRLMVFNERGDRRECGEGGCVRWRCNDSAAAVSNSPGPSTPCKPPLAVPCSAGKGEEVVLVNPQIVGYGEEAVVFEEGCLSFPELYGDVEVRRSGAVVGLLCGGISRRGTSPRQPATPRQARWSRTAAPPPASALTRRNPPPHSPVTTRPRARPSQPPRTQRPTEVTVRAQDLGGKSFELRLQGWPARIFQHEYDHLQASASCRRPPRHLPLARGMATGGHEASPCTVRDPTPQSHAHQLMAPHPTLQGRLFIDRMIPEAREEIEAGLKELRGAYAAACPDREPAL